MKAISALILFTPLTGLLALTLNTEQHIESVQKTTRSFRDERHDNQRRLAILSSGQFRTFPETSKYVSSWIHKMEISFPVLVDMFLAVHVDSNENISAINSTIWAGPLAKRVRRADFHSEAFTCAEVRPTTAANMFTGLKVVWKLVKRYEIETGVSYDYFVRYRHDIVCSQVAVGRDSRHVWEQILGEKTNPRSEALFLGNPRSPDQYQWKFAWMDVFWIVTRPLGEATFTVLDDVAKEVPVRETVQGRQDDSGASGLCKIDDSGTSGCRMHPDDMYFECLIDVRLRSKAPDATFIDNRGWWGCQIITADGT